MLGDLERQLGEAITDHIVVKRVFSHRDFAERLERADLGTLFKFDLPSRTHTVLHKFAGGTTDSGKPNGGVVLAPDHHTLYGTTHGDKVWGGNEFGILYQMQVDGSGFQQLYQFSGKSAGDTPMRTPLLIDGSLFGMSAFGGNYNYGTIWKYPITEVMPPPAQPPQASPAARSANPVSEASHFVRDGRSVTGPGNRDRIAASCGLSAGEA